MYKWVIETKERKKLNKDSTLVSWDSTLVSWEFCEFFNPIMHNVEKCSHIL